MRNNKLTRVVAVIFIGLMILIGAGILTKSIKDMKNDIPFFNMFDYKTETKLDVRTIAAIAMEKSDLVAAETECPGSVEYTKYEEKLGPDAYAKYLLNYSQNIEARIDLSKMSIEQKGLKIIVTMPNPTIKYNEPKITNFILMDESFFRSVSMTEGAMLLEAKNLIAEDVTKKINLNIMKDRAKQQAKNIIRDIVRELDKNNKYSVDFEFFYDNGMD